MRLSEAWAGQLCSPNLEPDTGKPIPLLLHWVGAVVLGMQMWLSCSPPGTPACLRDSSRAARSVHEASVAQTLPQFQTWACGFPSITFPSLLWSAWRRFCGPATAREVPRELYGGFGRSVQVLYCWGGAACLGKGTPWRKRGWETEGI